MSACLSEILKHAAATYKQKRAIEMRAFSACSVFEGRILKHALGNN
jgi:hypothetical protein